MDIRQVDNSQYSNRRRSRDYDMMPIVWRATPWPGTDLQISWDSSYIHSSYNAPGVQSPVVDKLIAQIIRWQGNKQKLLPLGRALDRGADLELLHAADVVYGAGQDGVLG
ncbi:ABC-type oligopeptide transport system, periplasmic component [Raoultella planticola]|uniref:ABC-type oligopeptide transport system, periplasmic component n=1 Tax=Raoultella planticola TaxID=575 RepID=A0A485ARZ6_RAOPL|nr:ABC-type oligopeptide transport system, periplasmic component [Raoultella planticola]